MVLAGALIPVGILLSVVLIVVTAVGSARTTDLERSQRAAARARRAERG